MVTKWIACVMIGDEDCKFYNLEEVGENETIEDAKRRVLKPEWEGIGGAIINYTPTENDIAEVLSLWDVFVFSNADYVKKLKAISPPPYTDELKFAVAEVLAAVYSEFSDEYIIGREIFQ